MECNTLADEVDQWSDPRGSNHVRVTSPVQRLHLFYYSLVVPLGETNVEFYQDIYTGQPLPPRSVTSNPPPLPMQPPAWQPELGGSAVDGDERGDGPSWVCRMCTFDNHPLMNKCEQCDMPRLLDRGNAGTIPGKSMRRELAQPL